MNIARARSSSPHRGAPLGSRALRAPLSCPHLLAFFGLAIATAGCHTTEPKTGADGADLGGDDGGGTGARRPPKAVGNPSGPSVVNFPGFEILPDGRSIVTVQVRGPFQIAEQKAEGRLVFVMTGVAVPERVNRLPLVTQHFPTQVTSVTVEQTVGGAQLLVDLREASSSTFKVTQNEAGNLLTITLPRSARWSRAVVDDPTSFERPTDTVDQTASEGAPDDPQRETMRRRRKSKRQPKPYVDRWITLPRRTIAPDIAIHASGEGSRDQRVILTSGLRWGIIDQVEVEVTPHSFRLAPNPAYAYPSLGITAGYTGHPFEIAGRLRYFVGIDSDAGIDAGALLVGVPMAIHLGHWGRIDTGVFTTLDFENSVTASPSGFSTTTGVRAGLVNSQASPYYYEPGIPFYFLFQPIPEVWFGIHHGIGIYDFSDAKNTFTLPLGAEVGFSAASDYNPTADLGFKVDLPYFIVPGQSDPINEQAYELGVWFRWYHHL